MQLTSAASPYESVCTNTYAIITPTNKSPCNWSYCPRACALSDQFVNVWLLVWSIREQKLPSLPAISVLTLSRLAGMLSSILVLALASLHLVSGLAVPSERRASVCNGNAAVSMCTKYEKRRGFSLFTVLPQLCSRLYSNVTYIGSHDSYAVDSSSLDRWVLDYRWLLRPLYRWYYLIDQSPLIRMFRWMVSSVQSLESLFLIATFRSNSSTQLWSEDAPVSSPSVRKTTLFYPPGGLFPNIPFLSYPKWWKHSQSVPYECVSRVIH